jgi:hypothetical protein
MTTPTNTQNQPHPTAHNVANPASKRSDLVYGESFPSWAELFPIGVDPEDEGTPLENQVVPLNGISPRFAADLFDGALTTALHLTDSQRTDDLLTYFLPDCLQNELERSGDRYRTDLILALMQRVDYLLRSLSNGEAPKPRCTADEWLLWVSCWIESDIASSDDCDGCDLINEHLPSTRYDDLDMMSEYLLEDEDLLVLWDVPGIESTVERHNEFGADIRDYRQTLDPTNRLGFAPLHIDGWFEPFYGGWETERR